MRTSRPRKGTSLRQTASFKPSCMFVRRSVRPLRDCEKNIQKNSKKKVTKSLYFTYAWGALIQPIAMEVCTFVEVTNIINHANFGGCRLRGLVSAKGRI
jgi:hypothetical protein